MDQGTVREQKGCSTPILKKKNESDVLFFFVSSAEQVVNAISFLDGVLFRHHISLFFSSPCSCSFVYARQVLLVLCYCVGKCSSITRVKEKIAQKGNQREIQKGTPFQQNEHNLENQQYEWKSGEGKYRKKEMSTLLVFCRCTKETIGGNKRQALIINPSQLVPSPSMLHFF
jgi:hypothetical protein